jgi:hypothetical protein
MRITTTSKAINPTPSNSCDALRIQKLVIVSIKTASFVRAEIYRLIKKTNAPDAAIMR